VQLIPSAPLNGVHGAVGKMWVKLDNVETQYAVMENEPLLFSESNGVITIDADAFAASDSFIIEYEGAIVTFWKNYPAINRLTALNEAKELIVFVMNWVSRTVTVTNIGSVLGGGLGYWVGTQAQYNANSASVPVGSLLVIVPN